MRNWILNPMTSLSDRSDSVLIHATHTNTGKTIEKLFIETILPKPLYNIRSEPILLCVKLVVRELRVLLSCDVVNFCSVFILFVFVLYILCCFPHSLLLNKTIESNSTEIYHLQRKFESNSSIRPNKKKNIKTSSFPAYEKGNSVVQKYLENMQCNYFTWIVYFFYSPSILENVFACQIKSKKIGTYFSWIWIV